MSTVEIHLILLYRLCGYVVVKLMGHGSCIPGHGSIYVWVSGLWITACDTLPALVRKTESAYPHDGSDIVLSRNASLTLHLESLKFGAHPFIRRPHVGAIQLDCRHTCGIHAKLRGNTEGTLPADVINL